MFTAIFILLCGLLLFVIVEQRRRSVRSVDRLLALSAIPQSAPQASLVKDQIDWSATTNELEILTTRLGKAGFFSLHEQQRAKWVFALLLAIITLACGLIGGYWRGALGALGFSLAGFYLGVCILLQYLRSCTTELLRETMFQVPLCLESLILLVEAGLGILPAIQQIVTKRKGSTKPNPVIRYLSLVYQLASHGVPISQALAMVANSSDQRILRHVLLHLDISGTEGGELIPSLRSLSGYAHTEWKLSVEHRVRRLENFVVFPVFVSVIGLMFLTAAVPLIPVLKLRDTITQNSQQTGINQSRDVSRRSN